MKIQVLYFAAIREQLGQGQWLDTEQMNGAVPATVTQLRQWLTEQSQAHARCLGPAQAVFTALNQEVCGGDQPLVSGEAGHCEVAFFPPVTGG